MKSALAMPALPIQRFVLQKKWFPHEPLSNRDDEGGPRPYAVRVKILEKTAGNTGVTTLVI